MATPEHLKRLIEKETAKQYPRSSISIKPAFAKKIGAAIGIPPKMLMAPKRRNGRSSIFESELEWVLRRDPRIPPFDCNAKIIPDRGFEFDFVWEKEKVALELEGGVWRRGGGAHSHPTNILRDIEKSNLAALAGYRLLRFTTDQHKRGEILPFLVTFFSSSRVS